MGLLARCRLRRLTRTPAAEEAALVVVSSGELASGELAISAKRVTDKCLEDNGPKDYAVPDSLIA